MKDEIIIVLLVIIILILIHRRVSFATPGTLTSPAPVIGGPDVNNPFKVGIRNEAQKTAFTKLFNDIALYLVTSRLVTAGSTVNLKTWTYGSIPVKRNCPTSFPIIYYSANGPSVARATDTHKDVIKQKISTFIQTNAALFGFGDANTNPNNPYRDQWNTLNNAVLSRIMPTPDDLTNIIKNSYLSGVLNLKVCDSLAPKNIIEVAAQNIVWSVSNYI